jgi:hypothetical protein
VTATVTLPDSFAAEARVWPRVGGTFTTRGDFRMAYWTPWAEVAARDGRAFTLRGYLFRVTEPGCVPCGGETWLPLPPDQARFGFTVLGPVERGPIAAAPGPGAPRERLAARPNPFRTATLLSGPAGSGIAVLDVAGRVVRRAVLDGTMGGFAWDGLDGHGRPVRPGLYLVRCDRPAGPLVAKVVRLE